MNQSDKKNFEFIKNSGVNYFLQDSPRNWLENTKDKTKKEIFNENEDKIKGINEIIADIRKHQTPLKDTANKLVLYDGNFTEGSNFFIKTLIISLNDQ